MSDALAMGERRGRHALIEQFIADGVQYMFGNPGTVEQGFLDALSDYSDDLTYILALHEGVAVGLGDGYARATKKPAVVQLHSGVGLGNGIGMMYQAKRGHAPLLVIAGESGIQYDAMDAQMAADLVAMAEPVTKWATRVVDPTSLLRVIRRALKIASTPPMGPVFVSLPMDVLDAVNTEPVVPSTRLHTRTTAANADVAAAASLLVGASNPMIIAGDGVAASGAEAELTRVAEQLGAAVWGADWSEPNIDQAHPLFGGMLGHMFGDHSRGITSKADAVLIVGTYVFPEVFPALEGVFAEGAPVVHIDLDAYEIGKNFPVTLGLVADPKQTLAALGTALASIQTSDQASAAAGRVAAAGQAQDEARRAELAADDGFADAVPLHAGIFARELARQLPENWIAFDEGLTTSPDIMRYLVPRRPGSYFITRGGSLGVGFPGAIGLKFANPDATVIGFSGDGGSMYTYQALWTAAHYDVDITFVVCNNASYELLKLNIDEYWDERSIPRHDFPIGFTLDQPVIDFAGLAKSLGVGSVKVEKPDQIADAVAQALAHKGPFLIDLVIGRRVVSTRSIAGADRA